MAVSYARGTPVTTDPRLDVAGARTGGGRSGGGNIGESPPWRQLRGKRVVSLINSHTNATSKRWHLWEIDLKFTLNSTPGWKSPFSSSLNYAGVCRIPASCGTYQGSQQRGSAPTMREGVEVGADISEIYSGIDI